MHHHLLPRTFWPGLLCLAFLSTPVSAQTPVQIAKAWELNGVLSRPESVIYDAERDVLYVSSINGGPGEKDGNGYLSKISPEGETIEKEWVTGLNAPKGLALSNGKLYVSDIDELVEIDPGTGSISARYPAEGAQFLNDVTADAAGNVYVSDSGNSLIYRLAGGALEIWLKDDRIASPNGVFAEASQLLVAAGNGTAENPGSSRYMQSISYDAKAIAPLKDDVPIGSLDAVEPDGKGGYFLTDWGAGKIMYFTPEDGAVLLGQLGQGTADLDFAPEKNMLFLPIMMSDQLVAYTVTWND